MDNRVRQWFKSLNLDAMPNGIVKKCWFEVLNKEEDMTKKSPEMEKVLNDMTEQCFGRSRTGKECVTCGNKAVKPEDFRDDLSRKEFGISMMCQCCQDNIFG